jgi:hypothetical protein
MITERRNSQSFGAGSFLFAVLLTLLLYFLLSVMVSRHFFKGGAPDRSKALSTLPTGWRSAVPGNLDLRSFGPHQMSCSVL